MPILSEPGPKKGWKDYPKKKLKKLKQLIKILLEKYGVE